MIGVRQVRPEKPIGGEGGGAPPILWEYLGYTLDFDSDPGPPNYDTDPRYGEAIVTAGIEGMVAIQIDEDGNEIADTEKLFNGLGSVEFYQHAYLVDNGAFMSLQNPNRRGTSSVDGNSDGWFLLQGDGGPQGLILDVCTRPIYNTTNGVMSYTPVRLTFSADGILIGTQVQAIQNVFASSGCA